MPAGHVGGGTALAATVTGVGFELPSSGVVIVMIPFEFAARADEVSSKRVEITDFMDPPKRRDLPFPNRERNYIITRAGCTKGFG
jgi:hypothetical protein